MVGRQSDCAMIAVLLALLVVPANGHAVWHAHSPTRRTVQLDQVTANGHQLMFNDMQSNSGGVMYGHGLAVRFSARAGHRFAFRASSVNPRRVTLRVRYHLER